MLQTCYYLYRLRLQTVITFLCTLLLKDGCLLDVKSHILYSPLPCQIPLPGFETFRFCVSQYEERDRMLLRNLCFVLGAKFVEKLTRKVTHLLCKFTSGPKYEAACQWGIRSVTSEWISECVRQVKSHFTMICMCPIWFSANLLRYLRKGRKVLQTRRKSIANKEKNRSAGI